MQMNYLISINFISCNCSLHLLFNANQPVAWQQDDMLKFKLSIRVVKDGGLGISENADFLNTTMSRG